MNSVAPLVSTLAGLAALLVFGFARMKHEPSPPRVPQVDPTCQVCGKKITAEEREDWVACLKCGTRHHADCWAYTEKCSTYACGSRRSERR